MKMKTMTIACAAIMCAGVGFARPYGPMHHGGFHCPPPMRHAWHHPHHHGGYWGRGGRFFWPGFVGGVIGGALANTVVERNTVVVQPTPTVVVQPTPTVVTTPVVVQTPVQQVQNVWVEGRYVDQVQPNGTVIRVWQPGHYEQRTVIVQ